MNYVLTKKAPEKAFISSDGSDVLRDAREAREMGFGSEMAESFMARGEKWYTQNEFLSAAKNDEQWPLELGYVIRDAGDGSPESICETILLTAIDAGDELGNDFHDMAREYGDGYKSWIKQSVKIAQELSKKDVLSNFHELYAEMDEAFESGRVDGREVEGAFVSWLAYAYLSSQQ